MEQKKLKIISGGVELFSNIDLMVYISHSSGQQIAKITNKKQTLIYCGDVIPATAHISPHWIIAYDNQPLISFKEKKKLYCTPFKK